MSKKFLVKGVVGMNKNSQLALTLQKPEGFRAKASRVKL
jgi:hypothetical protein